MSSVELLRDVSADPSSVALLLAGPVILAAAGHESVGAVALSVVGGRTAKVPTVTLSAPRRTGVGFTSVLELDCEGRQATGVVNISPGQATRSEVQLVLAGRSVVSDRELERWGRVFLADLARRASMRSDAA